jgi:hypothetical protein
MCWRTSPPSFPCHLDSGDGSSIPAVRQQPASRALGAAHAEWLPSGAVAAGTAPFHGSADPWSESIERRQTSTYARGLRCAAGVAVIRGQSAGRQKMTKMDDKWTKTALSKRSGASLGGLEGG